jgi:hypothetical protein
MVTSLTCDLVDWDALYMYESCFCTVNQAITLRIATLLMQSKISRNRLIVVIAFVTLIQSQWFPNLQRSHFPSSPCMMSHGVLQSLEFSRSFDSFYWLICGSRVTRGCHNIVYREKELWRRSTGDGSSADKSLNAVPSWNPVGTRRKLWPDKGDMSENYEGWDMEILPSKVLMFKETW